MKLGSWLTTVLQEALDVAGCLDKYLTVTCTPVAEAAAVFGKVTEDAVRSSLCESTRLCSPDLSSSTFARPRQAVAHRVRASSAPLLLVLRSCRSPPPKMVSVGIRLGRNLFG